MTLTVCVALLSLLLVLQAFNYTKHMRVILQKFDGVISAIDSHAAQLSLIRNNISSICYYNLEKDEAVFPTVEGQELLVTLAKMADIEHVGDKTIH